MSFVNMDMDLYSGAVFVLKTLVPHLSRGAVLHFHDFFSSVAYCDPSDEMRALHDVMFGDHRDRNFKFQLQLMPYETRKFRQPIVFRFRAL